MNHSRNPLPHYFLCLAFFLTQQGCRSGYADPELSVSSQPQQTMEQKSQLEKHSGAGPVEFCGMVKRTKGDDLVATHAVSIAVTVSSQKKSEQTQASFPSFVEFSFEDSVHIRRFAQEVEAVAREAKVVGQDPVPACVRFRSLRSNGKEGYWGVPILGSVKKML